MTEDELHDLGGSSDPEGEAVVRRLLADAGGPTSIPTDVAARLDDVLADLSRERAAGSPAAGATVVDGHETSLRTQRRWPRLLLAAAAVVGGGYGVGAVVTQGTLSGTSDSTMSAESADLAESEAAGDGVDRSGVVGEPDDPAPGQADLDGPAAVPEEATPAPGSPSSSSDLFIGPARPVRLSSDALQTGVRRALRVLDGRPATTSGRESLVQKRGCPAPGAERRSLSIRYDGQAGVLVAGPERRGVVLVTVYDCSGTKLVSTRVTR